MFLYYRIFPLKLIALVSMELNSNVHLIISGLGIVINTKFNIYSYLEEAFCKILKVLSTKKEICKWCLCSV